MEVDISKKVGFMLKYGLVGVIALSVAAAGFVWKYQQRHQGVVVYDAQVTGTLVGVKARTNGKITEILVKDGDKLAVGDVIAKVAVSVTEDEIRQLEQNLELAQRNLGEVQKGQTITVPVVNEGTGGYDPGASERLAKAEARLNRMNELLEMGAISAKKRDEAAAEYEAAQAAASAYTAPSVTYETTFRPSPPEAIKAAELQVKQAELALKTAQEDSTATEITAPVEGTVFLQNVEVGSELKAGQTVAGVGDAAGLWVEAKVTPEELAKIQLGQLADYEIGGREESGTVIEISSLNQETPANTEGIKTEAAAEKISVVKISLSPDFAAEAKPGMKATVKLKINLEQ